MSALARQFSPALTRSTRKPCRPGKDGFVSLVTTAARSRSVHTVHRRKELPYPIEEGVGDFLPPNALKTVVEWQDGLLERLNEQIRGTDLPSKPSILQIIIDTAGKKEKIRAFNYACLALNNSFFLDHLKPPGPEPNEKTLEGDLKASILSQFNDLNELKERFVASASGMASSGWLWLVTDGQTRLAVVPTFGAGTLLVRSRQLQSHIRESNVLREPIDFFSDLPERALSHPGVFPAPNYGPSPTSPTSGIRAAPPPLHPNNPARSLHSSAAASMTTAHPSVRDADATTAGDSEGQRTSAYQFGSKVLPLLCLSIHEHAWMSAGLGVWGKEEYVRRFLSVVDWKKVGDAYAKFHAEKARGTRTVHS